MAKPSSQALAGWTKEVLIDASWNSLDSVIITGIKKNWPNIAETTLYELVEENLQHIAELLRNEAAEWRIDGTLPIYEIDDDPTTPYVKSLENNSREVLSHLRKISPANFEFVCARILNALGAEASHATQQTVDGGIDFQAFRINIVPSALGVPVGCKAAVIGQAKRYKAGNLVREVNIREFVGAAMLRHHELLLQGDLLRLSPTLFAFWTTSDFDPGARKFARALGLWHMDGRTLANYVKELSLEDEIFDLPKDSQVELISGQ